MSTATSTAALATALSPHPKSLQTPLALSVKQFCAAYGLGHATVYRLIAAGDLPFRKIGRRSLISVDDAKRWFESQPVGVLPGTLGRGVKS